MSKEDVDNYKTFLYQRHFIENCTVASQEMRVFKINGKQIAMPLHPNHFARLRRGHYIKVSLLSGKGRDTEGYQMRTVRTIWDMM